MTGDPQTDQPITNTVTKAPENAEELRSKIRVAIAPAGLSGPGISILDRLTKVAITVTEPATAKALSRATGFDLDLVGDVLAGLVQCGAVAATRGHYAVLRPLVPAATEDELTAAWRSVELTVACPTCEAPAGASCRSRSSTYTSLHAERRTAALNSGPSQEAIAA